MTLDFKLEFDNTWGFIKVMDVIIVKAVLWIKFSQTDLEIAAANKGDKINIIPSSLGQLDRNHIRIQKPKNFGYEYINRKGNTSINLQATCNVKKVFSKVDASWPFSLHDYRIWRASDTVISIEVMYGKR